MIKFLLGLVVGICLLLLAGYLFVTRGGIFMGTKGGPLPMEQFLMNKALDASIGRSSYDESLLPADDTNLLAGAHIYQQNCAACHGRLDQPASAIANFVFSLQHLSRNRQSAIVTVLFAGCGLQVAPVKDGA